jgi:hypothetical protein
MEKKILLLITGFSLSLFVSAQTLFVPAGTNGIGSSSNDNVGIGTSTPGEKLEIAAVVRTVNRYSPEAKWDNLSLWSDGENSYINANGDEKGLHIKSNTGGKILLESNVGIGTSLPMYNLQVQKTSANPALMIGGGYSQSPRIQTYGLDADPNAWMGLGTDMGGNTYENSIYFPNANGTGRLSVGSYNGSNYNTKMTVRESGNVGIGTTSPAYKLDVLGTIRAKEVLVNLDGGADFVFEKDYKLPTIEHVATYVQENKHLPDIPSANEMVKNGVSMGDMQVKLLQKVEELTLYAIQQNDSKKELETKYNALLEKVEILTKKIENK